MSARLREAPPAAAAGRTFAELAWPKSLRPALLAPGGWTTAEPEALHDVADDRDRWLVFAPADGLAPRRFAALVEAAIQARPDVDVFYGDDAALGEGTLAERVRLKPAFDITGLAARDYIGAPLIVRAQAFRRLGGLHPGMGEAQLYDLVLRAEAAGLAIDRIPHLLLAWPGARPPLPREARRRALEAWIGARPLEVVDGLTPDSLALRRRFETWPAVTLVVPTRQGGPRGKPPFVVSLLDSLAATDWPMDRLTVLLGDDSDRAETFSPGRWPFPVTRVATPRPRGQPFSYAAKMNRLWRQAETEHLVLMNDDVEALTPGWLKALMTFAMERDVGGVGARLLFPDGRLQHAGVVGGLFGTAAHAWFGQPADRPTYQDWALIQREWSIVTAAVFATRRAVLEEANGFDERLSLEFNDVDLCLRLRLMGHRIVCTPFAELSHREKGTRGEAPPPAEEVALFLNRWRDLLRDDPAYHPALTRDRHAPEPLDGSDQF